VFEGGAAPSEPGYQDLRSEQFWKTGQDLRQGAIGIHVDLPDLTELRDELRPNQYTNDDKIIRVTPKNPTMALRSAIVIDRSLNFTNYDFWFNTPSFIDLKGLAYIGVIRAVAGGRVGDVVDFRAAQPVPDNQFIPCTAGATRATGQPVIGLAVMSGIAESRRRLARAASRQALVGVILLLTSPSEPGDP
jgi:hypothetical protein